MRRTSNRDAADLHVRSLNPESDSVRAFAPVVLGAIEDASAENVDVGSLRRDRPLHHRPTREVERLIVAHGDQFRLVRAGTKVNHARRFRLWRIGFHRIGEQQQGPFLAVWLDAEFPSTIQNEDQRVVILDLELNAG